MSGPDVIRTSGNEPEVFGTDITVQRLGATTRLLIVAPTKDLGDGTAPGRELVLTVIVPSEVVPLITARLRGDKLAQLQDQAAPARMN